METEKLRKILEVTEMAAAATMTLMQMVIKIREGRESKNSIGFSSTQDDVRKRSSIEY
jgi:hypothetical protein